LSGEDKALMMEIYDWFGEIGACAHAYQEATQD